MASRTIELARLQEYRFELDAGEWLTITLVGGLAEVFGFELTPGVPHPFSDQARAAVWTPSGATLEVKGTAATDYVAEESPMGNYLSLHLALSRLRLQARPSNSEASYAHVDPVTGVSPDDAVLGPRVMVIGERSAGKTTLIKTLANWSLRESKGKSKAPSSQAAFVVNLDPKEGAATMPGTLSILPLRNAVSTTSLCCPLGTSLTSGPPVPFPSTSSTPLTEALNTDIYAAPASPLVFFYGHSSPASNKNLFGALQRRLAAALKDKQERDVENWKEGFLVDTPGEWSEKKHAAFVTAAVRDLEVNVLLVLGNERLNVEMTRLMATNKTVRVVRVAKNEGASDVDSTYAAAVRDAQIRHYFYGGPASTQGVLTPFSIIVKFDDLKMYRVGEAEGAQAPSSALPIGAARAVGDTELVHLDLSEPGVSSQVVHQVCAVPQIEYQGVVNVDGAAGGAAAGQDEEKDEERERKVVEGPVLGFVQIVAVDVAKKRVTLLSPLPGRLPRKTLLVGSVEWQDA